MGWYQEGHLSLTSENEDKWAGECADCMRLMYPDEGFRFDWRGRKEHSSRPPLLQRVEWRFYQLEKPPLSPQFLSSSEWETDEEYSGLSNYDS